MVIVYNVVKQMKGANKTMFKKFLIGKEEELMNEMASEKMSLHTIFKAFKLSAVVSAVNSVD